MKVLIATGGSGGHIFPAVETAKVLRTRGHAVCFAGALGPAEEKIKALGFTAYPLVSRGLHETSWQAYVSFAKIMSAAVGRSFHVLRLAAPDKIIGFGSFGAFPIMMAGILAHRPAMIHEQNVIPGRANRVLSKFVKKVAVSFKDSLRFFNRRKTVWTGCPCNQYLDPDKPKALRAFGLQEGKKVLLMLGGSQGSQRLNEIFFNMMRDLGGDFQAIHMTGPKDYSLFQERYHTLNRAVSVSPFIDNISQAYACADIVIARSGAATLSELGSLGIPCVLVPYPFAGNHQKYNAHVLAACGAAAVIEQKNLTPQTLLEAVHQWESRNISREELRAKTKDLFQRDSALRLALALEGL